MQILRCQVDDADPSLPLRLAFASPTPNLAWRAGIPYRSALPFKYFLPALSPRSPAALAFCFTAAEDEGLQMKGKSGLAETTIQILQTEKRAFRRAARRGGLEYSRPRDLRKVLSPKNEWLNTSEDFGPEIGRALRRALRSTIRAKRRGSWRYSRSRHLALLQVLAGEMRLARSGRAACYTATAPPSGVEGSIEPVATPPSTEIPLGSA